MDRQRFAGLRWAGFSSAQIIIRRTELFIPTKLSAEDEVAPIVNVLCAPTMGTGIEDTENIPEGESPLPATW
jgi:hypothetical protein